MEIKYDARADVMYIRLSKAPFHENHVVNDTMVVDLSEDGNVIGIELISPSRYVDDLDEILLRFTSKDKPSFLAKTE
ncbi:MAG: DUF2283 domain-containing protein [Burkholderiales bacterium]|nr:DUF2283 domain-containing protein [Anaerolineae bacterium]